MARQGHKYKVACLGGTFDIPIHKGHEALLRKAFACADYCNIGLVTDEYAWRKGKRSIKSFDERKAGLVKFLSSMKVGSKRYRITGLDNFFDEGLLAKTCKVEAVVVSTETLPGARGINIIREDYDLKPLEIVEVAMVRAKDGLPISSTRIRTEEIDKNGKILRK
jgi:pantetheine-phosphate adenylyltransferase